MRISDWSSDVCSSDLPASPRLAGPARGRAATRHQLAIPRRPGLHDIGNRPNGRNAFQRRIDDRINLTRHSKAALSPTRSGKALQLNPGFQSPAQIALDKSRPLRIDRAALRPEERRGGKEWVSTCKS